ncbi:MAG: DUF4012 domain-containing protein [Anaerolineae bacterium]
MHNSVRVKWAGWVLVALGAILVLIWGVGLGRRALSLRGHLTEVASWAEAPETVEPTAACEVVRGMREDVVVLRRTAGGLVRLAPALGWLPRVGGELQAAPHLLAVGDGLTEAGAIGCDAAGPVLEALGSEDASADISPARVMDVLAGSRSQLEQARAAAERAQAAWERVDVQALSPEFRDKASLLDRGLPLLTSGLSAATVAPELLGGDAPRTYLVLALNEDERRPIGGYITGAGEVQVEAGELITMTFRDSYAADDFTEPYPEAPEPLQRYLGIDLLVFRDSNWSPDFPTAARQAMSLYRPGHAVSIDGVIALDQHAVGELVNAVGPVEVAGGGEQVTGETIVAYMRQAWAPEEGQLNREWWRQRKSFMGPLAQAVWDQVEEGDADWVALAKTVLTLLEEKHLLVYVEDAAAAEALAPHGWDGALQRTAGDFLMVVDANVGYNKASAKVRQGVEYEVDLTVSPPQANLTLVYTHTSAVDYACEPEIRYDPVYEEMMDRCYWDYIRVYVPEGSELVDATRIPVPREAVWAGEGDSGEVTVRRAEEGPWVTFGVLGLIPPGTTQTRRLTWTLPSDVVEWEGEEGRYSLLVQKQPGTEGHALTVRVRLPEESTLVKMVPPSPNLSPPGGRGMEEGEVVYDAILDRDLEFELVFRRGR